MRTTIGCIIIDTKPKIFGTATGDPASHIRLWLTASLGLLADLLSKALAWRLLQESRSYELIKGFLAIKLTRNPGIAFGIEIGWWPILFATLAGVVLILYLFLSSHKAARTAHISIGFILAGALGNLVDRLSPPWQVRDFIDFSFWPTFNLADVFLCLGVGLLALAILHSHSGASQTSRTDN